MIEADELLRRVAEGAREPSSSDEVPSDEELIAYRSGELSGVDVARLEALLAHSSAARQRLIVLAGIERDEPPAELRARVLARAPGGYRWRRWAAVAAVAAVILVAVGLLRHLGSAGLPPTVSYEIVTYALTDERGAEDGASADLVAFPDTTMRLEVTPQNQALQDVDFALYRLDHGVARRIDGSDVSLEVSRGVAVFTARCGDLVGEGAGDFDLLVVIARPGDLPKTVRYRPDSDTVQRLAAGSRRLVYPFRLIVLSAVESGGSGSNGRRPI